MADGWDDWSDEDSKSAKGSDKSEGWDWPAAEGESPALAAKQEQQQHDQSSALEEAEARDAAVDEMAGKYFIELRKYLEDLADPSVREEINHVGWFAHRAPVALWVRNGPPAPLDRGGTRLAR